MKIKKIMMKINGKKIQLKKIWMINILKKKMRVIKVKNRNLLDLILLKIHLPVRMLKMNSNKI